MLSSLTTLQLVFVTVTALWGVVSVLALCVAKPEPR